MDNAIKFRNSLADILAEWIDRCEDGEPGFHVSVNTRHHNRFYVVFDTGQIIRVDVAQERPPLEEEE